VGLLADQAWMIRALAHAYAVTLAEPYLRAATDAADYVLAALVADDGALLEAPAGGDHPAAAPARTWEDSPRRCAASVAAEALVGLARLAGREDYAQAAARALASFAGGVRKDWGTFLAGYALALEQLLNGPRSVVVVGGGEAAAELAAAARATYAGGAAAMAIDPAAREQASLLERLGLPAEGPPAAYVCRGAACLAPCHDPQELRARIAELAQGEA
jgi:hypothetical protein